MANTLWKGVERLLPESRCTPTLEDNNVYVTSGLGDIACVNGTTGSIIWSMKASEKYEGSYGIWGIAESPLLIGNKLIYTPGGDKTTIIALDKTTGAPIWLSESIKDKPSYTSPLFVNADGRKFITNVTENFIIGVDPDNGNILWKFDFGKYSKESRNIQVNTPLYHNGNLYVTNGYNHSSVMLKIGEDGKSAELKWVDSTLDVHLGGVVQIGDYIYGSNWYNNSKGNWVCLDWNTGKIKYETEWDSKGAIIAADGMLYCYEEKSGNVGLAIATPEKFEIISSFKTPLGTGPHWAHPVINNGILYIRHGEALIAYKIKE